MWSVSAYDEESNPLVSFEAENETDLQDLVTKILTGYATKKIRLLEIESLGSYND